MSQNVLGQAWDSVGTLRGQHAVKIVISTVSDFVSLLKRRVDKELLFAFQACPQRCDRKLLSSGEVIDGLSDLSVVLDQDLFGRHAAESSCDKVEPETKFNKLGLRLDHLV